MLLNTGRFMRPRLALPSAEPVILPTPNTDLNSYSVEWDFDFRTDKSYSGSGVELYNMRETPASGAARTDYTFQLGDGATSTTYPAYTSHASTGYMGFDGGDYLSQLSPALTDFIKGMPRSDVSTGFALVAVIYHTTATNSRMLFESRAASTSPGVAIYKNHSALTMVQRGDSATVAPTSTGISPVGNRAHLFVWTWDKATNAQTFWVDGYKNTDTDAENTCTTNATSVPWIGGSPFSGSNYLASGERVYQHILFSQSLSDSDVSAIRSIMTTRTGLSLGDTTPWT